MKALLLGAVMATQVVAIAPTYAADNKALSGQTLSVLLPPWGTLPKEMTDKFTADTGITLDSQTLGWDEIRTKIVTSMIANTAPASATEIDWSWVGQFGAAGWYQPLDGLVNAEAIADAPTAKIFVYDGKQMAIPYNNDFRILIYNKSHLDEAGIAAAPTTPDEMLVAARAVKKAGIAEHPIGLPLSATEGSATAWYLLTKAFGGDLFDADFNPLFTSPDSAGYKAMEFEVNALKEGLIDPASTGLKDVDVQELFKSGQTTFDVAGWAGSISVYDDPSKSKVAGQAHLALMISTVGKPRSFGLPEAVGIPSNAENPEAAAAFIDWIQKAETQIGAYDSLGNLPPRLSVLKTLNDAGKLKDGDVLMEQAAFAEPLFAQGTPGWYPEFSAAVASNLNLAAKGQITVQEAVQQIADQAKSAMQ
ncbi:MAG: extracellular solute-binding protein [Alphaproteobacteria bacterium]|nr:extracellular solute-binding protein [Alphaproteobacteria bacterium]